MHSASSINAYFWLINLFLLLTGFILTFFKFQLFSFAQFAGKEVNDLGSKSNFILAFNLVEHGLLIFLLLTVVFAVIMSSLKQRYEDDVKSIISFLQMSILGLEKKFAELYNIKIAEAAKELNLKGEPIEAYFVDIPEAKPSGTLPSV